MYIIVIEYVLLGEQAVYQEKKVRNSELLQILLLDCLYSLSGSEQIFFQGGTALRWIYGGMRFSEDLDFVTHLPIKDISKIITSVSQRVQNGCVAQFGPGQSEQKQKRGRKEAFKVFFIYRPEAQRERIAVKLEFETLKHGHEPDINKIVLRDLPSVAGLLTSGKLVMPYSSSIILAETPEEILADKIRAVYEIKYLKGRDIYDIWWLTEQLKVTTSWNSTRAKLAMYQADFFPAREADYFQKKKPAKEIINAMKTDLPRFIPQNIYSVYQKNDFKQFTDVLKNVTSELLKQGMKKHLGDYEKRQTNT